MAGKRVRLTLTLDLGEQRQSNERIIQHRLRKGVKALVDKLNENGMPVTACEVEAQYSWAMFTVLDEELELGELDVV